MYKLSLTQFLPISKERAWDFFSTPKNLSVITPPKLNFKILSISGGHKIHAGQIISYEINVFPFHKTYWETEITDVIEYHKFIDIQRKGPYSYWAHKHVFTEAEGGVEMTDELEYAIPFGLIGRLANYLFVGREVKNIFMYRSNVLHNLFKAKA